MAGRKPDTNLIDFTCIKRAYILFMLARWLSADQNEIATSCTNLLFHLLLPVLGWLDDGMVVTLLVTEVSQILLDRRKAQKSEQTATSQSSTDQTIDVKATV